MEASYQLSFRHVKAEWRKVRKTNFEQRAITHEKVGKPWRKSNFICNSSYGSFVPTFIQICESRVKKIPENEFWTKGNNSWKSRSTVTKVELDLKLFIWNLPTNFHSDMWKQSETRGPRGHCSSPEYNEREKIFGMDYRLRYKLMDWPGCPFLFTFRPQKHKLGRGH